MRVTFSVSNFNLLELGDATMRPKTEVAPTYVNSTIDKELAAAEHSTVEDAFIPGRNPLYTPALTMFGIAPIAIIDP